MSRKGFTLIELLVVVAVLALLASIVFSNLGGAREGAMISNALSFESQTHSLLGSDLIGWWKFDDDLNDTSGYGNNGNWGGAGSPAYVDGVPGKGGKAIDFDGIGDHIPNSIPIPSEPVTVSFWINRSNDISSREDMVWIWSNAVIISINSNGKLYIYDGSSYHTVDKVIADGKWYNIIRVDRGSGNDLEFYVDGNQEAVFISNISYGSLMGNWFTRYNASSSFYGGIADEVRIYSRPLSASEVQGLYAQTKDKYLANE